MKPAATVATVEGPCRWCRVEVHRDGARLVHVGSEEGYCADVRHVAEPGAEATRDPARVQCRLCKAWYAVADPVDHWSVCPGPGALGENSTEKKR